MLAQITSDVTEDLVWIEKVLEFISPAIMADKASI